MEPRLLTAIRPLVAEAVDRLPIRMGIRVVQAVVARAGYPMELVMEGQPLAITGTMEGWATTRIRQRAAVEEPEQSGRTRIQAAMATEERVWPTVFQVHRYIMAVVAAARFRRVLRQAVVGSEAEARARRRPDKAPLPAPPTLVAVAAVPIRPPAGLGAQVL